MQKTVNNLLHREMSRKEFLTTLGVGLISIAGFSSLIKLLEGKSSSRKTSGYGSSPYGR